MVTDAGSAGKRHQRLSERLRDNLRRRKEQSRARAAAADPERSEASDDAGRRDDDVPDESP